MLKAIRVHVKLHWGFSVKHPLFSATQPSYRLPPPPTLIGALAYPYQLLAKGAETIIIGNTVYSSAINLLDKVVWVSYRIENPDPTFIFETRDLTRVLQAPYVRAPHIYPYSPNIWGVQAHGKIYAPTMTMDVVYVVKGDTEKLAKAAWGLTRVGVKEALASVDNVEVLKVEATEAHETTTRYSFPLNLASTTEPTGYIIIELPVITREWFQLGVVKTRYPLERFVIPVKPLSVKLSPEALALHIEDIGYVIVPKHLLGR